MKNILLKILTFTSFFILAACSPSPDTNQVEQTSSNKILLGSHGSDVDIWKHIAVSQQAKDAGIQIEVKEINDGIALNQAVLDGEIDVNAFQSWAYFREFNKLHNQKLAVLATTYLEPMGLYSHRYKALKDLPEKAVIAIPNDVANIARALRLLERAQLIKLKSGFNTISGTLDDIESNPKQIQFKLIKGTQLPRVLDEIDLAAIGNTIALEGGLNVLNDSLFKEEVADKAIENVNILVVQNTRLNDEKLNKLQELYHQAFVDQYIKQHFGGTKLAIDIDPKTFK